MYTNADSLQNKMTELENRLKSKHNTTDEIHILAITEVNSKITKCCTEMCEFQISGYDMFFVNQTPKEGRGIILYVKSDLEATPVFFNVPFQECAWISIPVNNNKKDSMLVGCLYRSPNSSDGNNHQLLQLLNEANCMKYSDILILGDFNFPHVNWELECAVQSLPVAAKLLNFWTLLKITFSSSTSESRPEVVLAQLQIYLTLSSPEMKI